MTKKKLARAKKLKKKRNMKINNTKHSKLKKKKYQTSHIDR
jgi:hypothetical protein